MFLVIKPMTLLIISEAISRKLNPRIMEKEISLFIISFNHPFFGLAFTFHIVFMEFCMSTNTVVEVIIKVTTPMIIPTLDRLSIEILRTRSEERRVGKECRSRWSPDQ